MSGGFDVVLALRRITSGFWHDFAPIVVLGFGMVTLPEVALAVAGTHAGSTVIATFAGLLRVLYVVIVSHGALTRLAGKPLPAQTFAAAGLAASPRAFGTALLLGAGVVVVLISLLLANLAGPAELLLKVAIVAAAGAGAVLTVAAVPLALTERVTPFAAIRRAVVASRGARAGIAMTMGLVALAIVPARLVIAAMLLGLAGGHAASGDAALSVASPGLWLLALFDLLAWSVGTVVPAAVYVGLVEESKWVSSK